MIITPKVPARAFISEIEYMRFVEHKTTRQIAQKYGVSTQRISRLLGNTWQVQKQRTAKLKEYIETSFDKTNTALSKELGLSYGTICQYRNGNRHAVDGGAAGTGAIWEDWISEVFISHGFRVDQMPYRHHFDILIDGAVRIDVKVAADEWDPPSRRRLESSHKWHFHLHTIHKDNCDFYACIIAPTKDVFIIPHKYLIEKNHKTTGLVIVWPFKYKSQYKNYVNNFELIRGFLREEGE